MARVVKNPPANAGDIRDAVLFLGSGRSSRGRHCNPLQYSCLENPMDIGAWQAAVLGVAKVGHDLQTKEREVGHSFSSKERVSFNFTAAVTICTDFEAP